MESIGEKLQAAREAKKLTIKDVVKDTNINPIYIEALEEEKFDKFPSETYIIGFLKSYSEYLKLDVDAIVKSYKGYKIGESATPLEELTKPTKSSMTMAVSSLIGRYKNLIFVAVIVFAALVIMFGFRSIFLSDVDVDDNASIEDIKEKYDEKNKGSKIENLQNLQLNNNKGIVVVSTNEAVQFLVDSKEVVFLLKKIVDQSVEMEMLPGNKLEKIVMNEPKTIKLAGVSRDIVFTLKGLTENRAKIMVLLGDKGPEPEVALPEHPLMQGDNTTVEVKDKSNLKIIFEAEFVQQSFVEVILDGTRKKRGFVPQGTRERWEASGLIQIKIGNAGGLKARINGKDFNTFGRPGQVVNKIIKWKRDLNNPNKYSLVVKDW